MTWKNTIVYAALAVVAVCLVVWSVWSVAEHVQLRRYQRAGVRSDTVTVTIHDTAFVEVERRVVRHDTVRLAAVNGSDHFADVGRMVPDTAAVDYGLESTDSVAVSVPISSYVFEGTDYRITAEGYRVSLTDVWMRQRVIYRTQTVTKARRWAFGAGVQVGYGYTLNGLSPYAGIGVSFGYWF